MHEITRRYGESIHINDDITVTVLGIQWRHGSPQVRLGIDAPKAIPVHRKEIAEKIKREREREAAHYLNNSGARFLRKQAD